MAFTVQYKGGGEELQEESFSCVDLKTLVKSIEFAHTCPFNKRKDIRREEKRSKQHVDDRSGQHTRIYSGPEKKKNERMIAAASKSVQSKRTEVVRKEVGLVDLVGRVAEQEVPVRGGEDGGNAAAAVVGGGRDLRHPVVRGSAVTATASASKQGAEGVVRSGG
uniref:Uncharacterized protein n=1 Tax=Oryza sativa subsp. japonica TaxID=39947 RepID=Q10JW8_ORYSJ|nr:hypothetical protein LOC_Os03g29194 [Oryza sativa Japonica Group]